ncbi:hypothetical protein ACGFX2_34725 [Streptomyces goshikiensis]|uniref:hypothetical protein n=1 Tax=Streptomyces goshikiensis TaxID=1942 RepID=UPI00372214BF
MPARAVRAAQPDGERPPDPAPHRRPGPRLPELSADQLHAAASALVDRGRLLELPEKQDNDY